MVKKVYFQRFEKKNYFLKKRKKTEVEDEENSEQTVSYEFLTGSQKNMFISETQENEHIEESYVLLCSTVSHTWVSSFEEKKHTQFKSYKCIKLIGSLSL